MIIGTRVRTHILPILKIKNNLISGFSDKLDKLIVYGQIRSDHQSELIIYSLYKCFLINGIMHW